MQGIGGEGLGPKKMGNRPVAVACYICGRDFGTRSIDIHVKAC